MNETLLTRAFVAAADTMVTDFDVVDFLSMLATRCVELFDAGQAGFMLADAAGHLQVVASSSHEMRLLELFELQHDQGPCPDAYWAGSPVLVEDLHTATRRWPTFAPEALDHEFSAVFAFPLRLRTDTIGALNLIRATPGPLPDGEIAAAQALADIATIGLIHHRGSSESSVLTEQLQYALDSRVVIEQAKGFIAHEITTDMDTAFNALRQYSREHNRRLIDVAADVVDRTLPASALTAEAVPSQRRGDR